MSDADFELKRTCMLLGPNSLLSDSARARCPVLLAENAATILFPRRAAAAELKINNPRFPFSFNLQNVKRSVLESHP